ncbi:hypothetical protein GF323_00610 [Candidatus Woesearchaeota archaeon]|nr:hypothetical protein [Candidatus Woesearchaeota archaeon]
MEKISEKNEQEEEIIELDLNKPWIGGGNSNRKFKRYMEYADSLYAHEEKKPKSKEENFIKIIN